MTLTRAAWVVGAICLTSCSFIVAGDFKDCTVDSDCDAKHEKNTFVCLKSKTAGATPPSYCVPMPEYCRRESGEFGDANAIKIAAALPLTAGNPDAGTLDDSEVGGLNAIKLAMDEVNVRTIDGKKFALYVCDTFRDKGIIASQTTWLSDELGVKAILFSGSGQGIEAHKVTSTRNVLLMSATATSPELVNVHQTSGLLWRTAPPDTLQGKVLTDFIKTDPSFSTVTKVSVVYLDDAYGQGLKSVIQAALTAPYVVRTIPYTEGDDLTPVVNALKLQAPQLTVLIAFRAEAKDILTKAATTPGLTRADGHQWMFTDSAKDPAILDSVTFPQVVNAYGFAPAQGAGTAYPAFSDSFLVKYGVDPGQYSFLSHAYDEMYVVALAHAWALGSGGGGTVDGLKLADGIQHLSSGTSYELNPTNISAMLSAMKSGTSINIEGTSGKLDFNPDAGAPGSPIERWQIVPDGGIETKALVEVPLTL